MSQYVETWASISPLCGLPPRTAQNCGGMVGRAFARVNELLKRALLEGMEVRGRRQSDTPDKIGDGKFGHPEPGSMTGGLVASIALALVAALIGALLAVRLGQSAVIGYIAAGVVIGPFTPGLIVDPHTVEEAADLGLVFLLFTIGAELSLRDLLRAGRVAVLGGTLQVLITIGIGDLIGIAVLGWDAPGALSFGAVLAISSSAVLSKILGERGELEAEHGRIALAWSTVQDLATIVLVVLLPALSV